MKKYVYLLAAMSMLSFSAWVQAQGSPPKKIEDEKILTARTLDTQPVKRVTVDPNYSIGPEDVLSIDVWKEPEISRTVPVRPDGKISLPLLNDVQAAGMTPTDLASDIVEKLGKLLVSPQVTVIVTQINSQRIYILGNVARAGAYPLLPNMTMLQALSSAGGFTAFANLRKVSLMRTQNDRQEAFSFDYKEVLSGHKPEPNIHLKAGDTIIVP